LAEHRIITPFTDDAVALLKAGDRVLVTGSLLAARDEAHRRLAELIRDGRELPVSLRGQTIYYVGPTPARPGRAVGSAGPTSSYRMDTYTPALLALGLKATIGKGQRGPEVRKAMLELGAVYLAAVGGTGALLSERIESTEVVAWPELGPESLRTMQVRDFPCIVIDDIYGGDLYEEGRRRYRETEVQR
jgi:fumarate hydratase subunit beta